MDEHILEGHLSHALDAGEYHPGHPEEYYIVSCHQHAGGIEVLKILGITGPSQGAERPKSGRKPCIENVVVLGEVGASALGTNGRDILCHYHLSALIAVVCGDPVAPPKLAAYTPVLDILHPVIIGLVISFRYENGLSLSHRFNGRLCKGLHLDEPLLGDPGLNRIVAAVACTCGYGHILGLYEVARFFKVLYPGLSAFVSVHAGVLPCRLKHGSVFGHELYHSKALPLAHFKVVGVCVRRDLNGAGSLGHIGIGVCHNGHHSSNQRKHDLLSNEIFVSFVFGIYGHSNVSEHGLRS